MIKLTEEFQQRAIDSFKAIFSKLTNKPKISYSKEFKGFILLQYFPIGTNEAQVTEACQNIKHLYTVTYKNSFGKIGYAVCSPVLDEDYIKYLESIAENKR